MADQLESKLVCFSYLASCSCAKGDGHDDTDDVAISKRILSWRYRFPMIYRVEGSSYVVPMVDGILCNDSVQVVLEQPVRTDLIRYNVMEQTFRWLWI